MILELVDTQGAGTCELVEHTRRGHYSSIAARLRRHVPSIRWLERITVSQNAPDWRRQAITDRTQNHDNLLTAVRAYDTVRFSELWIKTATAGHRSKLFILEAGNASE